jgi:DNA polymerase-3 subunit alpha
MKVACLHAHSRFSFQDSLIRPEPASKKAKEDGYISLSITDHGSVGGVLEHYAACKKAGIIPLLGCEYYITPDVKVKDSERRKELLNHITVYSQNAKGVHNLFKLSTFSFLEGFYYKPRIDYETLYIHQDGLVVTSGCLKNDVAQMILRGDDSELILKRVQEIRKRLGERYYLEMMPHALPEQVKVNEVLYQIHKLEGIPMVISLDAHYLNPEDAPDQDMLMAMQMHTDMNSESRPKLKGATYHLMAPQELYDLFIQNNPGIDPKDVMKALDNTAVIAEGVVDTDTAPLIGEKGNLFPSFGSDEADNLQLFESTIDQGWEQKQAEGLIPAVESAEAEPYRKRLVHEMEMIEKSGFHNYFMVVRDIVNFAREQNIPHGIGRGTVAASLVSWLLGITGIDPLKYNLVFERFINPMRTDYPDIDMDFCQKRRDEVLRYIMQKYGEDKVAQIATFSKRSVKSALKDVGRVLNIPFAVMNDMASAIPWDDYDNVQEAVDKDPQVKKFQVQYPTLFEKTILFEGSLRQAGKHAAGVVISSKPLKDILPLMKSRHEEDVIQSICQFDSGALKQFGLIKMDILGLQTLTVIDDIVRHVREIYGKDIDLYKIPMDDADVYKMIANGDVDGVFQLDKSYNLKNLIRRIKPDCIQDLRDIVALYRPAPLKSKMDELYCVNRQKIKNGETMVFHEIPVVHEILSETYGTFIFQEQIMSIISRLAGLSLGVADEFRKIMAKNKTEAEVKDAEMQKHFQSFFDGCAANGVSREQATKLWETIAKYNEYTFNKPHSVSYGTISYWMAYLKHHYPKAFMLALFNSAEKDVDKIKRFILMSSQFNVGIRLPLINEAAVKFSYSNDSGALVWGLGEIKGVSEAALKAIMSKRPFSSLQDMSTRIGSKRVFDRRVVRALYKAGAFCQFDQNEVKATYDKIYDVGAFDNDFTGSWMEMEKEVFGTYVTKHPLDDYRKYIAERKCYVASDFNRADSLSWLWCGVIDDIEFKMTKGIKKLDGGATEVTAKKEFCTFVLEDYNYARAEVVMFQTELKLHKAKIKNGSVVMFNAKKTSRGLMCSGGAFINLSDQKVAK